MSYLSERVRRRAEWSEGVWVSFGEFGRWNLPRPTPVVRRDADGRAVAEYRVNGSVARGYADLVGGIADAESEGDFAEAALSMASALLLLNYDLVEDEVIDLL